MTDLTLLIPTTLPAMIAIVGGLLVLLISIYCLCSLLCSWLLRKSKARHYRRENRRINQGWTDAAHRQERIAGYDWREAKGRENQNRDY